MAGVGFCAVTGAISTGTAAKTLLQLIAAANQRALLKQIEISFAGISPTAAPIKVDILRQTNAGSMSELTLVKANPSDDETLQTTATHTSTGEPSAGNVLWSDYIHPQQGLLWQATFDTPIVVPGGTRLGIRVTAGESVNALVSVRGEE